MYERQLRLWGAAGLMLAWAPACGQTERDAASDTGPGVGGNGTASGASSGSPGSGGSSGAAVTSGGSSGAAVTSGGSGGAAVTSGGSGGNAAGSGGSSGIAGSSGGSGGAAGSSGGGSGAAGATGCPVPGESRNVGFTFSADPLPLNPAGDSTISEGMYPCVIVVPELENDTMVLHLDCDQMIGTVVPLRVTVAASSDPDPNWGEFQEGRKVEYRWRVDTHGWRLDRWVSLVDPDSRAPLLIAYLTGSEFLPERLEPFQAELITDPCPPMQEDCYQAAPQALALGDANGNSVTLFPRSTDYLGDHQVWVSRFEERSDFQCTDLLPYEYGVLIILEPASQG